MKQNWRDHISIGDNNPILETDTEVVFYDHRKDILLVATWNGRLYEMRILCPYSEEGNSYICKSLETEF